jgi:hypothetical protein
MKEDILVIPTTSYYGIPMAPPGRVLSAYPAQIMLAITPTGDAMRKRGGVSSLDIDPSISISFESSHGYS